MKVVFTKEFDKVFSKLDKPIQKRILDYMGEVEKLENPMARGKALASNLSGLWRYRVGDYRVICNILENELLIMTLKVEHRKSVYK